MEITAGKFYRTRAGQKARIYEVYHEQGVVHGAVFAPDKEWDFFMWLPNGRYWANDTTEWDLISEWSDHPEIPQEFWQKLPAWANYVWKRKHDNLGFRQANLWYASSTKPIFFPEDDLWEVPISDTTRLRIPSAYCPKFEGSIKDSLITRPQK